MQKAKIVLVLVVSSKKYKKQSQVRAKPDAVLFASFRKTQVSSIMNSMTSNLKICQYKDSKAKPIFKSLLFYKIPVLVI